jgi:hypothetical protein
MNFSEEKIWSTAGIRQDFQPPSTSFNFPSNIREPSAEADNPGAPEIEPRFPPESPDAPKGSRGELSCFVLLLLANNEKAARCLALHAGFGVLAFGRFDV